MFEAEGYGKTIEKAIEDALFVLKAPREDVDIKIIDEGGLFKKAKVLVSISEDCREKYQSKTKNRTTEEENEPDEVLDVKALLKGEEKKESNPIVLESKPDNLEKEEKPKFVEKKREFKKLEEKDCVSIEFVKGLLKEMNLVANVEFVRDDEDVILSIKGEELSDVIGFRGECLNAIQYLANVVEARTNPESQRVIVDCENYREKREATLISLAERMAKKVAKTHHSVKLEPMNANERRIIHTALAEDKFVETFSKGSEPNRFLIIAPKR